MGRVSGSPPVPFGMCTRRTGGAWYVPDLGRRSTITLTMDRYSHTVVGERAAALDALPALDGWPEREGQKATGIYATDEVRNIAPGISDSVAKPGKRAAAIGSANPKRTGSAGTTRSADANASRAQTVGSGKQGGRLA